MASRRRPELEQLFRHSRARCSAVPRFSGWMNGAMTRVGPPLIGPTAVVPSYAVPPL
ncbi:hypothetical protein [Nonomuraea sp. NPDC049709]|uniref:hypothetical protein n=1 Tax=Nonomuraea sp. NPDC049709 TaxID=3154736 RepID=UPI003432581A